MPDFLLPLRKQYHILSWNMRVEVDISRNGVYRLYGWPVSASLQRDIQIRDLKEFFEICQEYGIYLLAFAPFAWQLDSLANVLFWFRRSFWNKVGCIDKKIYQQLQSKQPDIPERQPKQPFMVSVFWSIPEDNETVLTPNSPELAIQIRVNLSPMDPPIGEVEITN